MKFYNIYHPIPDHRYIAFFGLGICIEYQRWGRKRVFGTHTLKNLRKIMTDYPFREYFRSEIVFNKPLTEEEISRWERKQVGMKITLNKYLEREFGLKEHMTYEEWRKQYNL